MKVQNIIRAAGLFLGEEIDEAVFSDEEEQRSHIEQEVASDNRLSLLLRCVNNVLDELAVSYYPNVVVERVTPSNGVISYAVLSNALIEVVALKNCVGQSVGYRLCSDGIMVDEEGCLTLVYSAKYPVCNFFSEFGVSNGKITERVVAYGVCAEYCLAKGDFENLAVWDGRYRNALLPNKRPNVCMPPVGRWI